MSKNIISLKNWQRLALLVSTLINIFRSASIILFAVLVCRAFIRSQEMVGFFIFLSKTIGTIIRLFASESEPELMFQCMYTVVSVAITAATYVFLLWLLKRIAFRRINKRLSEQFYVPPRVSSVRLDTERRYGVIWKLKTSKTVSELQDSRDCLRKAINAGFLYGIADDRKSRNVIVRAIPKRYHNR